MKSLQARTVKSSKMNRNKRLNVGSLVRATMLSMQERKAFSTQISGVIVSPSGLMINLTNGIVEGADINQRSGTTIRIVRMHFRHSFAASANDQSARFILFRDNMNAGTTPSISDVLPTSGYLSHFSDVREIQQKRYTILYDKTVDVSNTGPSRISNKAEIRYNSNVYYNAPTAVVGANGKGAVFLLVIGSFNTGVYDYDWQCEFTDS